MNEEDIKALRELAYWKNCPGKDDGKCQGIIDYIFDNKVLPVIAKSYGDVLNKLVVYGTEASE